jgi:cysteine sulfinate desulfinase/cysteine desulfurase-like protein
MGVPRDLGIAALRFSFGRSSSTTDMDALVAALPRIVQKVRSLSAVLHR